MKEYRDHYFLKAKQENYPARSVYKLKEIDGRFKIFRKGMKVLDLGAAPGSWSLGAAERVGAQGKVLACDIQSTVTVFPPNVEFHQEDVFRRSEAFERQLAETGPFHLFKLSVTHSYILYTKIHVLSRVFANFIVNVI